MNKYDIARILLDRIEKAKTLRNLVVEIDNNLGVEFKVFDKSLDNGIKVFYFSKYLTEGEALSLLDKCFYEII